MINKTAGERFRLPKNGISKPVNDEKELEKPAENPLVQLVIEDRLKRKEVI